MKNISVKLRIALWLTLLMGLLAMLLLAFVLMISKMAATETAMSQLSQTVQSNLRQTKMIGGFLELGSDFSFYRNGVSTLIYSREKALLAGRIPISFDVEESFQNGLTRVVSSGDEKFLVLDLWLPMGWEEGVWIRGLIEAPENRRFTFDFLKVALVIMPAFMVLAAFGSYWIVKKAFGPLDSITATAMSINEAQDLSRRVGLPPKKDEFSQLAATFDELFQRLERSFESEKQFAADASHELRTPVSVIKGACEYAPGIVSWELDIYAPHSPPTFPATLRKRSRAAKAAGPPAVVQAQLPAHLQGYPKRGNCTRLPAIRRATTQPQRRRQDRRCLDIRPGCAIPAPTGCSMFQGEC